MTWVRIDDGFRDHPKFLDLSLAAVGLWASALAYCNKHNTDGRVPRAAIPRLGMRILPNGVPTKEKTSWVEAVVAELVGAGLWELLGDGSIAIHDFLDWNPSKEQVMSKRAEVSAKRSAAGKVGASRRWQSDSKGNGKPIASEWQHGWQTDGPIPSNHSDPSKRAGAREGLRPSPDPDGSGAPKQSDHSIKLAEIVDVLGRKAMP